MHQVIIISNDKFYSYIRYILALRKEVFLNNKFRRAVGLKLYVNLKNSALEEKLPITEPKIITAIPKSNAKLSNSTSTFFAIGRGQGDALPVQQNAGANIPQSGQQPLSLTEAPQDDFIPKIKPVLLPIWVGAGVKISLCYINAKIIQSKR